ncbi:hypothetical protein BD410DRAFT_790384 [Rickenella mellea]|uniref:Uncharacterized protein n=1 Tax=Rickenella mellea TaxID=50990 RepID=A0A4Y7Q0S4_9AGAM|nr:hypothetical protein BD410DRAFT_790384 [Rickenella mellea]
MPGKIVEGRQNLKRKQATSGSPAESQAARRRRLAKAEATPLGYLQLDQLGRPPYSSRRNEFRSQYQAFKSSRRVNIAVVQAPQEHALAPGVPTPPVAPLLALQAHAVTQQEQAPQVEDVEVDVFVGLGPSPLSNLPSTPLLRQLVEDVDGNAESVSGSATYSWAAEYEGADVSNDATAGENEDPKPHSPYFGAHVHNDPGVPATQDKALRSVAERSLSPGTNAEDDCLPDAKRGLTSSVSTPPPQARLSDMKGKGKAVLCHVADTPDAAPNLPNQASLAPGASRSRSRVLDNGDQEPEGSAAQSHRKSSNLTEHDIIGDTVVAILRGERESWTLIDTLLAKMHAFNPRWNQRAVTRAIKDLDCLQCRPTPEGDFYKYIEHNDSCRERRLTRYVSIMDKLSTLS